MFSNYLSSIDGIGIYPLISLFMFFAFFVSLIIWTVKANKSYISRMSRLPLEEGFECKELKGDKNEK